MTTADRANASSSIRAASGPRGRPITPVRPVACAAAAGGCAPGVVVPARERRVLEFGELFDPGRGVPVLVVTFLALLELARELLIEITQSECFAPIYVKLGHAQS